MTKSQTGITNDWRELQTWTAARIALGRAGGSLPTDELLRFAAAHGNARDAVGEMLDVPRLQNELAPVSLQSLLLKSAAADRATYLRRPDLGRRLSPESRHRLQEISSASQGWDLVVILADGLSAAATQRHAPPLLSILISELQRKSWSIAPLMIVEQARVAIQDEIGASVQAKLALILLGERPGLGSPDSLGAYLVYHPHPGRTDADRNCVSNIRPQGLPIAEAAVTLSYLLQEAHTRRLSGVALKDDRALPTAQPLDGID